MGALKYLQNFVHQAVNHNDPGESADFRKLTSTLFKPRSNL